ncbi:hypothetical protein RHODO2019_11060 [Rhodococcus antarcticus]|uniref:Uncharacterized protein n=1 Tax=Rhodococcus antarcticus TaxID=2987751 RepID=A0ABY6NWH5_9NOCA|nr:hypothetical protein [Rhodococcus antarcticus]UZJ23745.1 hypothetical protein RHODO2019_11060 [Rhodococcus antarcticus]
MKESADWTVLDTPEVIEVANKVASKLASQFSHIAEQGDALQECFILLALNADRVRGYLENDELGFLYTWLYHLTRDKAFATDDDRASRHVDLDEVSLA